MDKLDAIREEENERIRKEIRECIGDRACLYCAIESAGSSQRGELLRLFYHECKGFRGLIFRLKVSLVDQFIRKASVADVIYDYLQETDPSDELYNCLSSLVDQYLEMCGDEIP